MIHVYVYRHTTLWELKHRVLDITFEDLPWEDIRLSNDTKPVSYVLRPDLDHLISIQMLLQNIELAQWFKDQGKNMLIFMQSDIYNPSPILDTDYFVFYQRELTWL